MTITIERRSSRSWRTWALQSGLQLLGPAVLVDAPGKIQGHQQVKGSPELKVPPIGMRGCKITARVVDGFHVYDITKDKTDAEVSKRVYFLAGGGFKAQASLFHWFSCAHLVDTLPDCVVTMVSYPLAPANTAPAAFASIQHALQTLLAESKAKNETVIFAGDSAGANIVLSAPLATLAEDSDALVPKAILVVSPCVDFAMSNPQSKEIESQDSVLTHAFAKAAVDAWGADWPSNDPRLSPTYADLKPLVKRNIQVFGVLGTHDVLCPDAQEFMHKLDAAGVNGKFLVWEKQMHDFPLVAFLGVPESVEAFQWIVEAVRSI